MSTVQKITPNLWFNGNAEEAAEHYVSIFPNSRICRKLHITEDVAKAMGVPEGSLLLIEFELDGQIFQGLNGGPQFTFNEASSLNVNCKDQKAVDHYWEKLGAGGDPKAEAFGEMNREYSEQWPNITRKKPAPADADQWKDVPNKYAEHFSPKPGT